MHNELLYQLALTLVPQIGDVQAVFKALYAAGVDGVFTDFPKLGVAARR